MARLRLLLGTLTVFLLALTPSIVPVGGTSAVASATTVSEPGGTICEQTVTPTTGVTVAKVTISSIDRCVITFKNPGNTEWTVPSGVTKIDVLLVGGGGGGGGTGGRGWSGGGGAGGSVKEQNNYTVSGGALVSITVGAGGAGGQPDRRALDSDVAQKGGDSTLGDLVAAGGGPGGHAARDPIAPATTIDYSSANGAAPRNGGGGGAQFGFFSGATVVGSSPTRQGGNGFGASTEPPQAAGGGAGAGASGTSATSGTAGSGGAGVASSITGSSTTFGGGGGGGKRNNATAPIGSAGAGGAGGGGAGGHAVAGTNGLANTGGGGGGGAGSSKKGGDGGSGIVIVRYSLSAPTPTFGTPTRTTDGFTVPITNHDAAYTWSGTATSGGTVSISESGVVTVTGVAPGTSSTVTVKAAKTRYVDGSATVSATSLAAYTVTLSKGSASGATGSNQTATKTEGVALTLPNSATANGYFTRTGYTVSGWSTNANGLTTDFAFGGDYVADAATTLYPVWTPDTYTVTYVYNDATGGNSTLTSSYTVDEIVVSLPTPTRSGFSFGGWFSDVGLTTSVGAGGASYAPTGDITLYAKWVGASYTVLFDYNGATGGNPADPVTYSTGGTAITLPTPTREGYSFVGWYSDIGLTTLVGVGGGSFAPTSNQTIYAKWSAVTRTVTYNGTNSSAGSVPTDAGAYIIGDTVVVKANSGSLRRNGYTFEGWVTNEDGTGVALNAGQTLIIGTTNLNLYPKWSADTYTISYNLNGGTGDIAGAPTSWQTGTGNVTLPTIGFTKTGFDFDGWEELGSTTKLNTSYQPNYDDVTLVARWTIKNTNYSFDKGIAVGQTIADWPTDSSGNFGTTVTLPNLSGKTVTVDSVSYVFFGWSSGGTTYNSGDSYVLGEVAPTFTAQWVRLFDVRYGFGGGTHTTAGNGASECVTGGLCVDGQAIVLRSAPEKAGHTFSGWKIQDSSTIKNASSPHTVSAAGYLFYAQWSPIVYQFTFNSLGGSTDPVRMDSTIGQLVTMPSPGTKAGYTFAGWSADGGSTLYLQGASYLVGTSGQAFSAQWIPRVYRVTYDWQGGISLTPTVSDDYTVGTGDMALPTARNSGYSRDGFTFSGWAATPGGAVVSGYQPTGDAVLYAVWTDGAVTITYDSKGGTLVPGSVTITRGTQLTLPTPVRSNFTFVGWFDAPTGGSSVGNAGAVLTPTASSTLYARWVQDSLFGVDLATLETGTTFPASDSVSADTTLIHEPSGMEARVQIPAGSLPDGTIVTVRRFRDTSRQSTLIPGDNNYFFALLVSWLYGVGDSATVPNTAPGKPILVTLNNPDIKAGAMIYQIIGERVTELGRATADGTVTVELTEDPQIVIAATRPGAPSGVTGVPGDGQVSVSWTPGNSGGLPITGYTVTASPGGATCSTSSTSCTFPSLTNNTAYSFTVRATNALGSSGPSAGSSAVTPVAPTYAVTFNSNGGTSVASGSFSSGGSVSAPTAPNRSGFTFEGWSTVANDATTAVTFPYAPGTNSPITLFALWEVAPATPTSGGGSGGANNSSTMTTRPNAAPPRPPAVRPRPTPAPTPNNPATSVGDPTAGPQATVGGIPVTATMTVQGGGVSIAVGQVQVGITPTNPSQFDSTSRPGQATDLVVAVGQTAGISGGGFLPGSRVQLRLPGFSGGSLGALAQITVDNDGAFNSNLTFNQTGSTAPVPIGRHILQVAGVDENGKQAVIDVTVTIVQGQPSPEPNRTQGELPKLLPGQSLATSAGIPESVTIEVARDTRQVAVLSGDWTFTLGLPEGEGIIEQTDVGAMMTLVPTQTVTLSGKGFQPDTRVDVWLFSDPALLGSATVAADGSFTDEFSLDAFYATPGDHTLQLQGVGADGFIKAANLGVVVQESILSERSDSSNLLMSVGMGLAAIGLILATVLIARRSNRKQNA